MAKEKTKKSSGEQRSDKIETRDVFSFLNKSSEFQRILIKHCSDVAMKTKEFIEKYNIPKEEFCDKMQISKANYNSFVRGGFNYDLRHMVRLQRLIEDKEKEKKGVVAHYSDWEAFDGTSEKTDDTGVNPNSIVVKKGLTLKKKKK
jgi:hypothetical protein